MVGEIRYIWRKIIADFLAYSSNSVEGPSFINNLDYDQSKYTKNAFNFCMDNTTLMLD